MTAADWREFLSGRGYTAGVGEPLALFYKEVRQSSIPQILALHGDVKVGAAYPDAKFLLTDREPHAWYRSMRTAILRPRSYLERPPISWIFSLFRSAALLLSAVSTVRPVQHRAEQAAVPPGARPLRHQAGPQPQVRRPPTT